MASALATGGVLDTQLRSTVTWAESVPPWPSLIAYSKLASPLPHRSASGVKVTTPAARLTVPPEALNTELTVRVSPSTSLSLSRMAAVTSLSAEFSSTMIESSSAIGSSLTHSMSTVTWPVSVSVPSLTV